MVPASAASPAAGPITAAAAADLRQDCEAHRNEAAGQRGWARSRFEQCHRQSKYITLYDTNTLEPKGHFEFDLWTLAFAYDGTRRVDYVISVENAKQSQQLNDQWSLLTVTFTGCASRTDLTCTGPQEVEKTIGDWYYQPHIDTISVTSPDTAGAAPFATVGFDASIGIVAEYRDGRTRPLVDSSSQVNRVRFDSAGSALGNGKYKGTVFLDHTPTLVLPLTGAGIDEEARHVDDALHHTERTFPSSLGKNVPGETRPLHRLMDATQRSSNHSASVGICRNIWGDGYAAGGQECDEYPFQSTYEGSATSTNNQPYTWNGSARPINGDHNGAGGTKLANFYGANRILDNDAFYVKVSP
ncbi:hypothetical protein KZQ38_09515 [Saccharothrix sp. SC076]|nr:hypothetical protein [Saccharothrix obliqua]